MTSSTSDDCARFSPRAQRDLVEVVKWIAKDPRGRARTALARAAERIGRHHYIGVTHLDLADDRYRFVTLSGFPYVIVYNAARQPPLIVRVLHGARDLRELLRDL